MSLFRVDVDIDVVQPVDHDEDDKDDWEDDARSHVKVHGVHNPALGKPLPLLLVVCVLFQRNGHLSAQK